MNKLSIGNSTFTIMHLTVSEKGSDEIKTPGSTTIKKDNVKQITLTNTHLACINQSCLSVIVVTNEYIFNIFVSPSGYNQDTMLADKIIDSLEYN